MSRVLSESLVVKHGGHIFFGRDVVTVRPQSRLGPQSPLISLARSLTFGLWYPCWADIFRFHGCGFSLHSVFLPVANLFLHFGFPPTQGCGHN